MLRISRPALFGTAIIITALPLLALNDLALQQRLLSSVHRTGEAYKLPAAGIIRGLSFGYHELTADLLWIRTIAYFTDHVVADRDLRHLDRYLDNILALDNRFKEVYRYGAAMLMSRGERQTNDDVFRAISLLKRAHEQYPDDPQFPLHLGSHYMSQLKSRSKDKVAKWRREGADWIRRAALVGADIPWLPSLAAKIYSEQGQRELAIQHLQEIYLTTQDEATKRQIEGQLKTLQAKQLSDQLAEQAEQFARDHKDSGLTFVSADLYAVIALPKPRPFSLRDLFSLTGVTDDHKASTEAF